MAYYASLGSVGLRIGKLSWLRSAEALPIEIMSHANARIFRWGDEGGAHVVSLAAGPIGLS